MAKAKPKRTKKSTRVVTPKPAAVVPLTRWQRLRTYFGNNPTRLVLLCFAAYACLIYVPYVLKGGLQYDDWSVARLGRSCSGLINAFQCYWPNYAHRPFATVYYDLTANAFKDWAPGYIMVAVTEWLAAVLLMFNVLRKRLGLSFATPFLFVAAIPSVASNIIFSPAMQSVGAFSFLVWVLSFVVLDRYITTRNKRQLWGSYALMLASLLFYESSLPLFAISLAWPFILRPARTKLNMQYARGYIREFFVPVLVIMIFLIVYQKLIIVHLVANSAALSKFLIVGSHANVLDFAGRDIMDVVYLCTFGIVSFIAHGLLRLKLYSLTTLANMALVATSLAIGLVVAWRKRTVPKSTRAREPYFSGWYLVPVLIGITSMHFVALQVPTIVGYLNRGMVAAAIVTALAAAFLWQRYTSRYRVWMVVGVLLLIGYAATFVVQRNNYIEGNRVRNEIQADILPRLRPLTGSKERVFVIGDVPTYLGNNFNSETIFSDEVLDWAHFLFLKTHDPNIAGISLSAARLKRGDITYKDGQLIALGDKVPLEAIWYYNADTKSLVKVTDDAMMARIFKQARNALYPIPVDGIHRESLRSWLATY